LHILSPVALILLAFFKVDNDFFTSSLGGSEACRSSSEAGANQGFQDFRKPREALALALPILAAAGIITDNYYP